MINAQTFGKIDEEVKRAVVEAFDFIRNNCSDHHYILFLADGEYKKNLIPSGYNPYVIDSREDRYKDASRLKFLVEFLATFYAFPLGKSQTDDHEQRLHMELMVYTHIWESKPFLKRLFRLTSLVDRVSYLELWDVFVPEMNKHKFIRNTIRDTLAKYNLNLATIITKGFHTSLRNAFAHSEYVFDTANKTIHLDTYRGESWDIENISFDEWSKRFVYSALLSYHLLMILHQKRTSLAENFHQTEFLIIHPKNETRFGTAYIKYNIQNDSFSFKR